MKRTAGVIASTLGAAVILVLAVAAPASADTWCVPEFNAACPNNGTNVQELSLEDAMAKSGDDGIPDKIIIGEGTLKPSPDPAGPFHPEPTSFSQDDLEVVGAGVDKTRLSSTGTSLVVMNLTDTDFRLRKVTFRDLSFVAPPGTSQSLLQSDADTLDGVNFESQDPTEANAAHVIDGGEFRNTKFFGTAGGISTIAMRPSGSSTG